MSDATSATTAPAPDRIFLTPAPGLRVAKPSGGYLAEAGEAVNAESYWRRRVTDGDAVEGEAPTAPAEADATPAAAGRTPRDRS